MQKLFFFSFLFFSCDLAATHLECGGDDLKTAAQSAVVLEAKQLKHLPRPLLLGAVPLDPMLSEVSSSGLSSLGKLERGGKGLLF